MQSNGTQVHESPTAPRDTGIRVSWEPAATRMPCSPSRATHTHHTHRRTYIRTHACTEGCLAATCAQHGSPRTTTQLALSTPQVVALDYCHRNGVVNRDGAWGPPQPACTRIHTAILIHTNTHTFIHTLTCIHTWHAHTHTHSCTHTAMWPTGRADGERQGGAGCAAGMGPAERARIRRWVPVPRARRACAPCAITGVCVVGGVTQAVPLRGVPVTWPVFPHLAPSTGHAPTVRSRCPVSPRARDQWAHDLEGLAGPSSWGH